jgi:hypothetical protein
MGLTTILRLAALLYYRWALREMDPLHPDLPDVVRRIRELEEHAPADAASVRAKRATG